MSRGLGALRSEELMKLPHDPSDENDDIWQLMVQAACLREQMEEFEEEERHAELNERLCTLEGLLCWCDDLFCRSYELYARRSTSAEKETPES